MTIKLHSLYYETHFHDELHCIANCGPRITVHFPVCLFAGWAQLKSLDRMTADVRTVIRSFIHVESAGIWIMDMWTYEATDERKLFLGGIHNQKQLMVSYGFSFIHRTSRMTEYEPFCGYIYWTVCDRHPCEMGNSRWYIGAWIDFAMTHCV